VRLRLEAQPRDGSHHELDLAVDPDDAVSGRETPQRRARFTVARPY